MAAARLFAHFTHLTTQIAYLFAQVMYLTTHLGAQFFSRFPYLLAYFFHLAFETVNAVRHVIDSTAELPNPEQPAPAQQKYG